MKTLWHEEELEFTEPERYELHEGPFYHFEVSRREFVQVLGAGILISVAVPSVFAQRAPRGGGGPVNIAERLHIGADGTITVFTSKVEVGQGSRTQLTQAAAEELRVPLEQVKLIMADSSLGPDDGGTAGSRTTPASVPAIRKGCAAARKLLVETAATTFNVDAKTLSVRDGKVEGLGAGKQFGYADLASEKHARSLQREVDSSISIADVKEWRVLGTPAAKVGAKEIVTGGHRYPSDIRRPDMLYGKVLRPVSYGAKLGEIDLAPAKAIEGVTAVRDGDFVGFAAPTSFDAQRAREEAAKTAKWKSAPHPASDELYSYLRTRASQGRGGNSRASVAEALKTASKTLRESYHIAYIQHAPMEPRAAVAEWADGKLTVWTGTQQPSRVRQDLASAFNISRDRVRVIVPDTGGGFGGKHSGEAAVEAARLALAAKKPVSVRWSREDEFTWAYFRPAGVIDVAGGLDEKGTLVAWEHINFNSGNSAINTPYAIRNAASEFKSCDQPPLRAGSYRALASTANAFARESFMDELAAAAAADPLAFRLRHLTNERLRAVLVAATERFGWKNAWKKNSSRQKIGVGLGCGTEKGSYVATCARVEVNSDGTFKLLSACTAFECGAIQNPANLKAQVDGCVIMGIGGALREEMRFKDGKILNAHFSQYHVPRFKDVPEMETVLVNRPDLTSVGAGETPIIGIAPAIANALFNAVQVRIRSLPIRNADFRAA